MVTVMELCGPISLGKRPGKVGGGRDWGIMGDRLD